MKDSPGFLLDAGSSVPRSPSHMFALFMALIRVLCARLGALPVQVRWDLRGATGGRGEEGGGRERRGDNRRRGFRPQADVM